MNIPAATQLSTDIQAALDTNETARARFADLPPSHRREYLKHIDEAKKAETCSRRIESMIARLSE